MKSGNHLVALNVQVNSQISVSPGAGNIDFKPFSWCIKDWKTIFNQARAGFCKQICSPSFYSHKNGYRMVLKVYPYGCGGGESVSMFISVFIVKGVFDDNLTWPFRHGLKVELESKTTNVCYISKTRKYSDSPHSNAWKKPSEKTIGIGFDNFISLAKLSEIVDKLPDNSIWFKITPISVP